MKNKKDAAERLFVNNGPAGEYGRLRDNVIFLNAEKGYKVFNVACSTAKERKTEAIANLAVLLGRNGRKVLIADLDFLHPCMHSLFGAENKMGLSGCLVSGKSLCEGVVSTSCENVDLLPLGDGAAESSIVLTSKLFSESLARLKDEYDIVLLDTSPVLLSTDYLHISPLSDATLFLAAFARVKRGHMKDAVSELKRSGANIVGAAFTSYDKKKGRATGCKDAEYYRSKK